MLTMSHSNPTHSDDSQDRGAQFVELFTRHRDQLFAYVATLIPHHSDAEDVFQRCSVVLWKKYDSCEVQAGFLPWAYGVAYNEVRNFSRSQRRSHLKLDPGLVEQLAEDALAELHESSARIAALRECVERLKAPERELLACAYESTASIKQLSEKSGAPLQTLYNRLARLRRNLLACVEKRLAAEFTP